MIVIRWRLNDTIDDIKLISLGFYRIESGWYYHCMINGALSLNVYISDKRKQNADYLDYRIDVIDERYLQPYDSSWSEISEHECRLALHRHMERLDIFQPEDYLGDIDHSR